MFFNAFFYQKIEIFIQLKGSKMHPNRHFTFEEAKKIRNQIVNGKSMRSLANEYKVSGTTIRNIRDQITYKEIQPISDKWISFNDLMRITGLSYKTLKKLFCAPNNITTRINGEYHVLKKDAQQYIDTANMIPLHKAASDINLTFQRLHQLKDANKITTLQIGNRYYVNPDQLKQEIEHRKQKKIIVAH